MSDWSPGIRKVLDHVARTDGWRLVDDAMRRGTRGGVACPITSQKRERANKVEDGFSRYGLDVDEGDAIVYAADGDPDHDPTLRAALLKAARLA